MGIKITKEELNMFNYLNYLRGSGAVNMFGAASYLANEFGIDQKAATRVLGKWMKNFSEDGYDHLLEDVKKC